MITCSSMRSHHYQTIPSSSVGVMQWLLLLLAGVQMTSSSFLWNYALFPPPDVDYSIEELCKRTGQTAVDLDSNVNFTRKVNLCILCHESV